MVPGYRAMYAGHIGKSLVNQTEGKKKRDNLRTFFSCSVNSEFCTFEWVT